MSGVNKIDKWIPLTAVRTQVEHFRYLWVDEEQDWVDADEMKQEANQLDGTVLIKTEQMNIQENAADDIKEKEKNKDQENAP